MLPYANLVRHEGNEALFRAIEMSLLSTYMGVPLHLHVEGLRGTGKTSIMRAAKQIVPRIARIRDCVYNCDPARAHCPHHSTLSSDEILGMGIESVAMPFMEISHSAKIGTVVGSIDLTRIVDRKRPEAALLPGTICQANRGILFVDEINRLAEVAPELADVLLSVMGTKPGWIQVEETGLPVVEMPICVSVWAASNPDEEPGPLEDVRRQLSDRFDFCIGMARPSSVSQVVSILSKAGRREQYDPTRFSQQIAESAEVSAVMPHDLIEVVARMYLDFRIESLRAVESMLHGAQISARLAGRSVVSVADLMNVCTLALRHRVDMASMHQILSQLESMSEQHEVAGQAPTDGENSVPQQSTDKQDSAPAQDGRDSSDPLAKLFSKLRDTFGTGMLGHNRTSGKEGTQGTEGLRPNAEASGASHSSTHSGGGIADPMKSALAAPSTEAIPMGLLGVSELVKAPEDLR